MAADVTVAPTLGHAVLMTQGGVGASPGYDAIDLRRMTQAASGGQEGVYNATGWKVRENAGGANLTVQVDANVGLARVNGESVTNQGPYVVAPHSAVITLDVTAAHATNPRIDLVILQIRDHTHDASGQNDARVRILAGTATGGATLDNLTGQQALPSNALRLADVLVPALDTTISNAQIRDRRPWAWGAFGRFTQIGDLTTTSTTATLITTNLQPRIECSGVLLRCTLRANAANNTAAQGVVLDLGIDGTAIGQRAQWGGAGYPANLIAPISVVWETAPAAGSHLVAPMWLVTAASTATFYAGVNYTAEFTVEEIVRQNAQNS